MPCSCGRHKTPQACAGARALRALPPEKRGRRPKKAVKASRRRGPLCACGCGLRCFTACRWASQACIPFALRSANARAVRKRAAVQQRLRRYRPVLDRLVGQRITREDLAALLYEEWRRGYGAGKDARRRERERQGAAA
jgi:hypothetical protein